MAEKFQFGVPVVQVAGFSQSNTINNLPLDSAYTYASAGDGIHLRFSLPEAKTLTDIYWYFAAAKTGDPALLNWYIREDSATAGVPGSTVTASGTWDPDAVAAAGWFQIATGLTQALSAQQLYYLILADADGSGTDYCSPVYGFNAFMPTTPYWSALFSGKTTNGFTSVTSGYYPAGMVMSFSDGTSIGAPYVVVSALSTSQLERGLICQFDEDTIVSGVTWWGTATGTSAVKVYQYVSASDPLPGGTAVLSDATSQAKGEIEGIHIFSTPITFTGGTKYRVVLDFDANTSNCPRYMTMGSSPPADVVLAQYAISGNWGYCEEAAGPVWTDNYQAMPFMALLVDQMPAIAGGGGRASFKYSDL